MTTEPKRKRIERNNDIRMTSSEKKKELRSAVPIFRKEPEKVKFWFLGSFTTKEAKIKERKGR